MASSSVGHPAAARSRVSLSALWFGLYGGPAAWSVQALIGTAVAAHGCFPRLEPLAQPVIAVRAIAFVVSLVATVVTVAAVLVSMRSWRATRGEHHDTSGQGTSHAPGHALGETGEGRTRFMALTGVLASLTFLLMIVVNAAAVALVAPCSR